MKLESNPTVIALGCALALACATDDGGRDGGTATGASGTGVTGATGATGASGGDGGSAEGGSGGSGDGGSGDAGTDGTDGATASGTGDDGGTRFDVGMVTDLPTNPTDTGGEQGCKKIDFMFVIDNSGSMGDEQMNLANSFPGFINSISNTVMAQDYHIMVVDTDAGGGGGTLTCSPAPSCCTSWCNANPGWSCNGTPCSGGSGGCDETLGAGKTKDQNNNDCGITSGARYMLDTQPNVGTTFSCVALVGTSGDGNEKPMEAMVEAVTTQVQAGQCNDGFLRDDALLVVTFITDEADMGKSAGNPTTWKNALVQAKNGDESAVVMLGLLGDNNVPGGYCAMNGDADDAPNLRTFAESWMFGSWGSVCEPDYAPFFDMAVGSIDTACDEFEPPG